MKKIWRKMKTAWQMYHREGLAVFLYKTEYILRAKWKKAGADGEYRLWIKQNEIKNARVRELEYQPKISVVVPVYNVESRMLEECIRSVQNQSYTNWELCLADDASTWPQVAECLKKYENHPKIKIVYRPENGHISRCTNSAIELATGEFVAFMDCDDVMAPNALYEVAVQLNKDPGLDFIYSDEDKIREDGKRRHQPHFKPDWSPDTFLSLMYTCHLGVYRKSIGDRIGWLRTGYEGAQDYDFTLRFTEQTDRIAHIPKILYHWRERKESTAVNPEAKSYIVDTSGKAKEDALKRRGQTAALEWVEEIYQYRVNYQVPANALVSVIIPSKDNFSVFARCVDSLREKTAYTHYEIILVDNGSQPEQQKKYSEYCRKYGYSYIYRKMEFNFSKMCNIGARAAKGDFLLFLNDDITIANSVWMERMAGHAALSHVGAVGAKMYYPNSTLIQHIGVISFTGGPVHSFCGCDDRGNYYFCRNKIEYNYSAVTAACLMVQTSKFWEVDGFDESFAVAYNDIDFCFKLTEKGYYNVSRMDAVLYHHESLSRGNDVINPEKMKRLISEREHLYREHPQYIGKDPFYNPNLTMEKADCSLNIRIKGKVAEPVTVEEPEDIPDVVEENIRRDITVLETNNTYVNIGGWCFDEKRRDNNWKKTKILLLGQQKNYLCDTLKTYSEEVGLRAARKGHYNLCYFISMVKRESLAPGTYQIVILKYGKKIATGKSFEI